MGQHSLYLGSPGAIRAYQHPHGRFRYSPTTCGD